MSVESVVVADWNSDVLVKNLNVNQAPREKRGSPGPLERYVQILEALTGKSRGLSAGEIERILGLPKTTVNRLLHGLVASNLVRGDGARVTTYHLGDRLIRVLRSDTAWIDAMSRRLLKEVAEKTGETCFIARLNNDEVTSIAMESPDAGVGVYVMPGHRLPPYATASGKLLIALQDRETIERFLRMKRQALTGVTMVSRRALTEEFRRIRKDDYAVERGEHVEGLATIACPIRVDGEQKTQFALGLTGSSERIVRASTEHLVVLRRIAGHLGSVLANA